MKKNKKKKPHFLFVTSIAIGIIYFLGGFNTPIASKKIVNVQDINDYFLNGQYDAELASGKIQRGFVRDHLNASHLVLNHKELPQTLIE